MTHQNFNQKLANRLSYVVILIMLLLPFHAFMTVWAGSNLGHYDLIKLWKEVLIGVISIPVVVLILRDRSILSRLRGQLFAKLFGIYVLLHLILGYWALRTGRLDADAFVYSLIINLRFMWFFFICAVIARYSSIIHDNWQKIFIWPSVGVVFFGLLQKFVLPLNFLQHFGYSLTTILPYQTIDNNVNYSRLQSTLRGANPLGAYLLLPVTALIYSHIDRLKKNLLMLGAGIVLFYSYSRSAWLGLVGAGLLYLFLRNGLHIKKKTYAAGAIIAISIFAAGGLVIDKSQYLQDTFLHTSTSSTSLKSSNSERINAMKQGASDIIHQPLGGGPGTAGPASARNSHTARISENYFLQIGQELGVVGLGLFIVMNVQVARWLWRQKNNTLSAVLLVSLVGITIINFMSHAWTDDTLSLLWWGMAGVACSPVILGLKDKANAQK